MIKNTSQIPLEFSVRIQSEGILTAMVSQCHDIQCVDMGENHYFKVKDLALEQPRLKTVFMQIALKRGPSSQSMVKSASQGKRGAVGINVDTTFQD